VIRTRVGYTGGTLKNPTYHHLGDHTESIQIDYDPAKISYERLLEIFWKDNVGCGSAGRQYRSAIFYGSPAQKKLAEATMAAEREKRKVACDLEPLGVWTDAEDYHQKYYLRSATELKKELSAKYPKDADFVASTAAARLNGYVGGNGTREGLKAQAESLGLTEEGRKALERYVRR